MSQSFDKCTLTAIARDAGGNGGATLEIAWTRDVGYRAEVNLWPAAPSADWMVQTSTARRPLLEGDAKSRHVRGGIDSGELVVKELGEGRTLELIVGTGAHTRKYTTVSGDAALVAPFNHCVSTVRDAAARSTPPARWTTTTYTGRGCEMAATIDGAPGLALRFQSGSKGQGFDARADSRFLADGGSLRFQQGAGPPWILETNSARQPWDPRAETLLAELLGLKAVPFTFTPAGGEPRNLATPMQGLAIASVMFDACTRAIRQPDLPAQPMFTELRYAIDEHDGVCEFTGTFQLRGNGMWLVLATDGTKHQLKITRRTVGPGEPVTSLDLSSLGGPGRLEAQDASYDFDPKAFKALLADIVGEGRPFKARLRGGEVFAVPFGGKFAGVEGPMFEACARVKLGGTP